MQTFNGVRHLTLLLCVIHDMCALPGNPVPQLGTPAATAAAVKAAVATAFLVLLPGCRHPDGNGGDSDIFVNFSSLALPALFPRLAVLGVGPVAGLGHAAGLPATSYGKLYMPIGQADGKINVDRMMMIPF